MYMCFKIFSQKGYAIFKFMLTQTSIFLKLVCMHRASSASLLDGIFLKLRAPVISRLVSRGLAVQAQLYLLN